MGIGSSKNRQPSVIPVADAVKHAFPEKSKFGYESLAQPSEVDAMQQVQPKNQQQVQQNVQGIFKNNPRYIGSTSYLSSADNTFKFVMNASSTEPIEFQEEMQNVKPNEKVPITQFNFFFVRHAKSCANEQSGLLNPKKLKLDDPFISNDGIFATIEKQNEYRKFFGRYKVDHHFCSPLIRTWCTAAMLFPDNISDFEIAPHLREDSFFNYSNHPYPYETNVQRFRFFSEYVETLTDGAVKVGDGVPGYALMNKAFADYGSDFVDQIGIELFMQWYIKNENTLGRTNRQIRNVVVTCHSESLKQFCNAHLNESQLAARGMPGGNAFFKHTNNYCIRVQVVMPVRQSNQVQHGRPLTSSESEEVKNIVAKNLEQQTAETEALNKKIAELTQADAVKKLKQAEDELRSLTALGKNDEPTLPEAQRLANESRVKQLETLIADMKNQMNQSPSAGGNKRKKTKRVKRTKSTKRQNKKTRVVKQRGGGNKYFELIERNLPFQMTITKAIDGTTDYKRDERRKQDDCICEPDAYMKKDTAFDCAKNKGKKDFENFRFRQMYKMQDLTGTANAFIRKS
jgi:hypothetical protein